MKRTTWLTLFILLFVFTIGAQAQQKPFKLGLQIAPGLGWMRPDASPGYSSDGAAFGFSWGFISDFALTDNYFVSTGFNLLANTGKISFPDMKEIDGVETIGTTTRRYNYKFLEIPLTLKMKTNQFGSFKYYGQIGLAPAFNISAKGKDDFSSGTSYVNEEVDIKDETGLLQASLVFGAGTEYYIDKSTAISTSLVFRSGFADLLTGMNNVNAASTFEEKATPFTVQLCIGVIF